METVLGKQVKKKGDKAISTEKNRFIKKELPCLELHGVKMEKEKDDLRAQVQVLEEIKNVLDEQNRFLNEVLLECQKLKVDTENGQLGAQVKYLQENEDSLMKDNEFLHHALARLQNQSVRIEKQNENLCAVAKVLKKNVIIINESTENLISDLYQIETQSDKNQTEIHRLRTELQTVKAMLQDQDDLIRRIDEAETLMKNGFEENTNLGNKLHDIEENNIFLKKQNDIIRDELEKNKSVQNQQIQQIAHLRTALKDHELSSEQVQFILYSKDDMIEKQKREIDYQWEVTEELNALNNSLRQIIRDLQSQVEQMKELFVAKKCNECFMKNAHIAEPIDRGVFGLELNIEDKDYKELIKDPQHDTRIEHNGLFNLNTVLFESLSWKMETENEDLKAHVKVLEGTKNSLTNKIKSLKDEVAFLTCRCQKMEINEEELRTQVKVLGRKCTLDEKNTFPDVLADVETYSVRIDKQNETLVEQENILRENDITNKRWGTWLADLSHAGSQRDKNRREMYYMRTEIQTHKCELKEQNDLTSMIDYEEKGWAKNEKLCNKLLGLEENNLKKDAVIREQLKGPTFYQNQQCKNIAGLKMSLKDHEFHSDKVQFVIYCEDDMFTKQERKIADQQEVTKEINTHDIPLTQTIHEELCLLGKPNEGETVDEGLFEAKMKYEKKDLRAHMNYPQQYKDNLIKSNELSSHNMGQRDCLRLKIETDDEDPKAHEENTNVKYHYVSIETDLREVKLNENKTNKYERTETLTDKLVRIKSQEENNHTETYHLSKEVQTLKSASQDHDLTSLTHHGESFIEKAWTENERIRNKLHELHENNKIVREQLLQYTTLREQQFANLKKAVTQHKFTIAEELYGHYREDKQKREQVYQHEITEMKHIIIRLRQTNFDLEGQLGQRINKKIFDAIWGKRAEESFNWFLREPRAEEDSVDENLLETETEEDSVVAVILEPRTEEAPVDDGRRETETEESVDEGLLETETVEDPVDEGLLEKETEEDSVDAVFPEPRTEGDPVDESCRETETEEDSVDAGLLKPRTEEDPVDEDLLETETGEDCIDTVLLKPRTKGDPLDVGRLETETEDSVDEGRLEAESEDDSFDEGLRERKNEGDPVDEGLLAPTTAENPLDEGIIKTTTEKNLVNMGFIETEEATFEMGLVETEEGPVDMVLMEPPTVEAYFEEYLIKPITKATILDRCLIETATEDNPFDVVPIETEDDLVCMGLIAPTIEEDPLYKCLIEATAEDKQVHEDLFKFHQVQSRSVRSHCTKKIMNGAKKCLFAVIILMIVFVSGALVVLKIVPTFSELCECLEIFQNY